MPGLLFWAARRCPSCTAVPEPRRGNTRRVNKTARSGVFEAARIRIGGSVPRGVTTSARRQQPLGKGARKAPLFKRGRGSRLR